MIGSFCQKRTSTVAELSDRLRSEAVATGARERMSASAYLPLKCSRSGNHDIPVVQRFCNWVPNVRCWPLARRQTTSSIQAERGRAARLENW